MNQTALYADSESYASCTNLSHFRSLSLTRGSTAGVCFLLCSLTLVLICVSKTWKTIHQRLFLYLTIATILYLAILTLHIEHYFDYPGQDKFCVAVGFLDQYSGAVQLFFALGITLFLFADVCFKCMKKEYVSIVPARFPNVCKSVTCARIPEVTFLGLAFVIPAIIAVVPFFGVSYGETGPWCWIKTLEDCKKSDGGFWEQLGLWYIPFGVVAVFSFLFVFLTLVVLCCWRIKVKAAPQQANRLKNTVVEAVPLTLFLIVYCVLFGIEFAGRIVATKKPNVFGVWALYAVSTPFSGVILPIAFLIYYFTKVIRIKARDCFRVWRACCTLKCCRHRHDELVYNISVEEGHRILPNPSGSHQPAKGYKSVTEFNPGSLFADRHNSDSNGGSRMCEEDRAVN